MRVQPLSGSPGPPSRRRAAGPDKPGRTRLYHVAPLAARTIAALLAVRDQIIGSILAPVRSLHTGRKPAHWIRVDRDYERIRIDMQTLITDLTVETPLAA